MTDVITFVYIYATNTPHLADVLASIVFVLIGCTTMTIFHCTGHFTGCLPRINLPPPEMQSCHPPLPSLAAANSQNCNSLLPSIQPFPGRGGIPPFPLPRVFFLPPFVRPFADEIQSSCGWTDADGRTSGCGGRHRLRRQIV